MLRARQRLGKYVIERKLGEGGFAIVFQARDTIEGIRVALKVPYAHLMTKESLEDFRHEVRLAARLDHPNILPLKYADFLNDHFVIVSKLGEGTLETRLQKRVSLETALRFAEQMIAGVAYAHEHRIIHCDIKPDNFVMFPDNHLRLTDFGIARVAQKTLKGSGAGTMGYIAPEQAMGKPSFRSDVFSLGVILYRMFSGQLPEWPYQWPLPGYERLKKRVHPELIALVRKAIEVDTRKRFRDARQMLAAFQKVKSAAKKHSRSARRSAAASVPVRTWKTVRHREFQRQFGQILETRHNCNECGGPVSEVMQSCPWCGKIRRKHEGSARFQWQCPRCHRGLKSDWRYCPWCYGPGFEPDTTRQLSDQRYLASCANAGCDRKELMLFMRYCPWCRRRVRRKWKIEGVQDKCPSCGWGVVGSFWTWCPWCGKRLQ